MPHPWALPPSTPSWFELHTLHDQAAVAFYRDVFGWNTCRVLAPWSVYFGAEDTDAALAKIVDLAGSILIAAEDTPYGRLAIAADPTYTQFKLVAPNEVMLASSSSN